MTPTGTMGDWVDKTRSVGTGETVLDRSREQSFRMLVDRRSQIADAYLAATYRHRSLTPGTDPKSTKLNELNVAERSTTDSAIAQVAVSQRLPAREKAKDVRITERWVGRVLEVEDGVFSAELRPLGRAGPVVVGDLQVEKVDVPDRPLISVNAPFYLVIGHISLSETTQLGVQHVLFSRVGKWRSSDLEDLRQQGAALFQSIEVDDPE
jgi:hypothetical protein